MTKASVGLLRLFEGKFISDQGECFDFILDGVNAVKVSAC